MMDYIYLYLILFVMALVFIVLFIKKIRFKKNLQNTKISIINGYKNELRIALSNSGDASTLRVSTKKELLKKFNSELSRNIFFDPSEIRGIILDIAQEG